MRVNIFEGRLGAHRFHSMLIHFPSALYPFSLAMDGVGFLLNDSSFTTAGLYALVGGCCTSILAMTYGTIDFLALKTETETWRKAGIHALMNILWFIAFCILMIYRIKHQGESVSWVYLGVITSAVFGLFYSNYLGADLIISHRVGIEEK